MPEKRAFDFLAQFVMGGGGVQFWLLEFLGDFLQQFFAGVPEVA